MDSLPFFINLLMNGIVNGLVIGMAALAITLVFAIARFPNAAVGDFMTLGAYAGLGVQALGITSGLIQGAAAILATMVISLLSYFLVFRKLLRHSIVALMVTSIGISLVIRHTLTLFVGFDQFYFKPTLAKPIVLGGVRIIANDLLFASALLLCLGAVFGLLFLSPIGRRMRAVADNPELARASGIDADRVMVALWLIVGAVSAVAGMVVGVRTVVAPELGWGLLLPGFAAAILGGLGSPVGAVVAGVILGVAQELSTPLVDFTYNSVIAFVVLIAILAVKPEGLFGLKQRVR
jgi:neutral amino acid transport system permease protein